MRTSAMVVRFTAVTLLASLAVVSSPSPAKAEACGTYHASGIYAGYDSYDYPGAQPRQFEGVSAVITDRHGYSMCSTDLDPDSNFSTSWTMVYSADGNGYVQSGTMMRPGYSCVRRWAQHLRTAGDPFANYYIAGCSVQGEQHQY